MNVEVEEEIRGEKNEEVKDIIIDWRRRVEEKTESETEKEEGEGWGGWRRRGIMWIRRKDGK